MSKIGFYKVTELGPSLFPNSLYFVFKDDKVKFYLTDSLGNHKLVFSDGESTDSRITKDEEGYILFEGTRITNIDIDQLTDGENHLFFTPDERSQLQKLAPAKPEELRVKTLTLVNKYTAKRTSNKELITEVWDGQPTVSLNPNERSNGFFKEDGVFTLSFNDAVELTRVINVLQNNTQSNANFSLEDYDFHEGVVGKSNFYRAIIFWFTLGKKLTVGNNSIKAYITDSDEYTELIYVEDDPKEVVITQDIVSALDLPSKISGVDCYGLNDSFRLIATLENCIGECYNADKIAQLEDQTCNTVARSIQTNDTIAKGQPFDIILDLTVNLNKYSEAFSPKLSTYNSKEKSTEKTYTTSFRIDSLSNESTRLEAGEGQYPVTYGSAYDSETSLDSQDNEAMQLAFGKYYFNQSYPELNGAAIDGGEYRWAIFRVSGVNVTSVSCRFSDTSGFTQGVMSGFILQAKVDGPIGTSGWVDGNSIFSPNSLPLNNGDAALDPSSTSTNKIMVFGAAPKTGDIYVRVGVEKDSGISFGQNLIIETS